MSPFATIAVATVATLTLAAGCGLESIGTGGPDQTGHTLTTTAPAGNQPPPTTADPAAVAGEGGYRGNLEPRVLARFPHDPTAFTQGLVWYGDILIESTGRWGQSTLRVVDPGSGDVGPSLRLDDSLFGEGVAVVGDLAYQLTWQAETLLVTDLTDLTDLSDVAGPTGAAGETTAPTPMSAGTTDVRVGAYTGEGWGLCHDGSHLVMSNGSDQLTFRNVRTFEIAREVTVTLNDVPVDQLNELECVDGQIWANVWHSTTILAIDPETGVVEATVDAADLVPEEVADSSESVLNGVAYNPATRTFWLTGKNWPVIYEVELVTG